MMGARQVALYTIRIPHLPLKKDGSANPKRKGALIRWQDDGEWCFADIMTWPEFGQDPVEKEIARFANGESSDVLDAARAHGLWEKALRVSGQSIPTGQVLQHRLVTDLTQWSAIPKEHSTHTLKIKYTAEQYRQGVQLPESLAESDYKLRFDLNNSFDEELFLKWWKSLPASVQTRTDFVEDPFSFSVASWSRAQKLVPLALDWSADPRREKEGYDYLVIKPASQNVFELLETAHLREKKWVFTHSFDSCVGRSMGEALATHVKCMCDQPVEVSGFHPPEIMVGDFDFSRDLTLPGLGFQKSFENLFWTPV